MNRNNIWIHISIAVVLIAFAAVLGQISRWKTALQNPDRGTVSVRVVEIDQPFSDGIPEVLVRFKPGISLEKIRTIASNNNDILADEIESVPGLTVIDDLDNADAEAVASQYAAMTDAVDYAEVNYRIELDDPIQKDIPRDLVHRESDFELPNDPMFGDQWALNNLGQDGGTKRADLDALRAWATTKGSEEVVVAVLDSGVDFTHVDLRENMWFRPENIPAYVDDELGPFNDLNGYNGTDNITDPMDDNGHGTHCAGIIGAEGNNGEGISGINWKVKIMPLKFLGRGGFGSTNDAIEAINYAIDRKKKGVNLRVISASWGSTSKSKALEDTIRAAGDAGILFVAAAGNNGTNNDSRPHYPSNYDLPNVVSVAALDRNDKLTGFSNFGVKTVHIAAPGKDILSTWLNDAYREASGTSMATPYVSGVAALIVADKPDISMAQLRERLLNSVDKLDSLTGKVASGGRVCAADSLGKNPNHLKHGPDDFR
ncbi:MAG: S8 family serine peptidase [Pyrinomonadaceae bacterium]